MAGLCVAGLLAGCDNQIPAFDASKDGFSVFGALSPDSTGQVVRVERLQDNIRLGTYPEIRETVRLVERDGDRSWTLDGQVVRDTIDKQVVFYHEFLVPDVLAPGGSYRIVATGQDGLTSRADVTVPRRPTITPNGSVDFCQTEGSDPPFRSNMVTVDVKTEDRVGDVRIAYEYDLTVTVLSLDFDYLSEVEETSDGYRFQIDPEEDLVDFYENDRDSPPDTILVFPDRIRASARILGPEWPGLEYAQGSRDEIADQNAYSTVENGVGVVYAFLESQRLIPQDLPVEDCKPSRAAKTDASPRTGRSRTFRLPPWPKPLPVVPHVALRAGIE